MIQIYDPANTDFDRNGDMVLQPSAASVHVILNGTWESTLIHPIDLDGRWKYIVEEAVVKLPSFNGDQLFRVKNTQKSDSGITAALEPIFFDSMNDCFLSDVRPTNKNGQEALNIMTAPNKKYSGKSDITMIATAYYEYMNLMEAINGENENSFINRWGGEILFNNFEVSINEHVGGDYGVELRYGKNIQVDGLKEEVDIKDVVTRLYPKAYNGYKLSGDGYVDSDLIHNYPIIKCATITFDDVKMREDAGEEDEENGVVVCDSQEELDAALTLKCNEQFASGMDKPKVTIEANMILLENTENYKEFKTLESVSLGDTIHCRNSHLGIVTDARVIELEYDSLQKKTVSVVLGDFRSNYFEKVTSSVGRIDQAIRPDGTVMAEKIRGFIDGAVSQLRLQSTVAKKQKERAILFEDLDPDSELYGAMAMGTQGLQIAWQRTPDGKEWDWATALTGKGLMAGIIVAGILSDKLGNNTWNLDTGELITKYMKATNADISGKLTSSEGSIAGFQMGKDGFQANISGKAHYTEADLMRAQQIALKIVDADEETIAYYDLNKDRRVTSVDLLLMQRIINGQDPAPDIQGQVRINPASVDAAVTVEGTNSNAKGFGVRIGIGQIDGSTAEFDFLNVKSLTVGNSMDPSGQSNVEITGQDIRIRGKSVYSLFA